MAQNSKLVQRGLLLFGVMSALVVGLWYFLIYLPGSGGTPGAASSSHPELVPMLVAPAASFPSTVNWGVLLRLADAMPSAPGWEVRYNATVALARRGSPKVPLGLLREMLDEDKQMKNFPVKLKDGRVVPDEAAARRTVLNGLKALAEWHKYPAAVEAVGRNNPELQRVYDAVRQLTRSENMTVKQEAQAVLKAIGQS